MPVGQLLGHILCFTVNVLEFQPQFGTQGLLGSTNNFQFNSALNLFLTNRATSTGRSAVTLGRRDLQGPNGWAILRFGETGSNAQAQQSITPLSATLNGVAIIGTHFGLPVIGAMFHNYTNTGVNSAYGGVIPHKFTRSVDLVNRAP